MNTLHCRMNALNARDPWLDSARIERGDMRDYHALARHHYRAARPGTVTRLWRAVDGTSDRAIGVLIVSRPVLQCRARDVALGGRYEGLPLRERALIINREVRTISRVIVHPDWRGAGLSVDLVRFALDHGETVYTEALAAMGRAHRFFERAGMRAFDMPESSADTRLRSALDRAGLSVHELADRSRFAARLEALPTPMRRFIERELNLWQRTQHGAASDVIEAARNRLAARPRYFLHRHGDDR